MNSRIKRRIIALSDKIVYASNAYVGLKSQLNSAAADLIDFSNEPITPADEKARQVAHLVRPFTAPELELIRVGGDSDGGYVMVNDFNVTGAISVGVGPDVSWDQDVASRGIPVHMFDPTIRRTPGPVPGGTFHRVGIGPVDDRADHKYRPLAELVSLAGFTPHDQLLLKIDVEGAEWLALPDTNLSQFPQILLELHDLESLDTKSGIIGVLQHLNKTHRPVHIHANNYDSLVRFGRYWLPNALEISYVRHDFSNSWMPALDLEAQLDRPNDPRVTEIDLKGLLNL